MLTFEQAEQTLNAQTKSTLAHLILQRSALPANLSPEENAFCFGLYTFIEYEQISEVEKYCL